MTNTCEHKILTKLMTLFVSFYVSVFDCNFELFGLNSLEMINHYDYYRTELDWKNFFIIVVVIKRSSMLQLQWISHYKWPIVPQLWQCTEKHLLQVCTRQIKFTSWIKSIVRICCAAGMWNWISIFNQIGDEIYLRVLRH